MRFVYTKIEPASAPAAGEGQDGQPATPPPPVRTIIEWEVDPHDIVAVGSLPHGCLLLLQGGHQLVVDGKWAIVAEKVKIAKRDGGVTYAVAPPAAPAVAGEVAVPQPPSTRGEDDDEEPGDVVLLEMHDGPAEVD